ncbi:metal ABC transporter solute-binding protein, Zn/Mn family [Virgibacillus siamensis]|uniref:metal ABC transporter solute-binding protein, Zn/Mn family n=1 Tax=Virgibacillus siamensis TaxID=480071 RepID=UPI0009858CAA|nr:zinc ABC transporter substrate-binding protein [Virgibacillus siamensis]
MRFYKILMTLFLTAIVAAGCSTPTSEKNDGELTVYTSIYPIQYAVDRIGGDTVHTESVYPPGVDAHTYEPSTKEMTAIAEGDAFIYLGAGMEGFAESAAQALDSQDVKMIELGTHDELFHTSGEHDDGEEHVHGSHHHGDKDPHIWLDPTRMLDMAGIIKGKLIDMNPENKDTYVKNFNKLKKDLLELDNHYRKTLKQKDNKEILVSHAAYGYWEERYGIEQLAISGLSSSEEPSQKELTNIIDTAKKHNLKYIIFEQNGSDRVSSILQEQLGAEALHIHNLSVLTQEDIDNGEDYLSLMKHNLGVLDKATN